MTDEIDNPVKLWQADMLAQVDHCLSYSSCYSPEELLQLKEIREQVEAGHPLTHIQSQRFDIFQQRAAQS